MTTPISEFRDIVHLLFRVVHPEAYHASDLHSLIDKLHDVLIRKDPPFLHPFEFILPSTHHDPPTLVIHPDQEVGEIVPNVIVTKETAEGPICSPENVRNVVFNLQTPIVHAVKVGSHADKAILKDLARDSDSVSSPDIDEEEDDADDADITPDLDAGTEIEDEDAEDAEDEDAEAEDEAEDEDAEDEDAEAEDEAEDAEAEDEAEDAEAEEAEEEEAEEEDNDLELLQIKKQKYYYSPSSTRIYEYLKEGYGDCIGTYVNGKIIAKE